MNFKSFAILALIFVPSLLFGLPDLISSGYSNLGATSLNEVLQAARTRQETVTKNGPFEETVHLLNSALAWNPQNQSARTTLALAYHSVDDIDRSLANIAGLQTGADRAIASLAAYSLQAGKPEQAVSILTRGSVLAPLVEQHYAGMFASAYGELGKLRVQGLDSVSATVAQQQQSVSEGLAAFDNSLRYDPQRSEYRLYRARLYIRLNRLTEAEAELKLVLAAKAWEVGASRELGGIYVAQARWNDAVLAYQRILSLSSSDAQAHLALIDIYGRTDRADEIVLLLQQWTNLEQAPAQQAQAFDALGDWHSANAEWDEAIAAYQRAIQLDPNVANYHISLALAYQGAGENDQAQAELLTAAKTDNVRSQAWAYVSLAGLYKSEGRTEEAIGAYKSATELVPNRLDYALDLARLYHAVGRNAEALREYERILMIEPNNTTAKAEYEALQQS